MKRKRRSVAVSRAASIKGWRTRRKAKSITEMGLERYRAELDRSRDEMEARRYRTADLLPKVEW